MKVNVGCGPHRAPSPWVNVDRVHIPGKIEPDHVNPTGQITPLTRDLTNGWGTVTHIYLGHVIEHIPWGDTLDAFLTDCRNLLQPGGLLCVVCPDLYRTLDGWKAGQYGWELVTAVLEDDRSYQSHGETFDGARHQWNAHQDRCFQAVQSAGFENVEAVEPHRLDRVWPIVSRVEWQCAITASAPA